MRHHHPLTWPTITFLLLAGPLTYAFDNPFISFPGVRAKAMGGAFTAVASDVSTVWYNPAGIATEGNDFIFEVTQAAGVDLDRNIVLDDFVDSNRVLDLSALFNYVQSGLLDQFDYDVNRTTYFLGYRWGKPSAWSIGAFIYQPYTVDWFYLPDLQVGPENDYRTGFGLLSEEMIIFGIAPAYSFGDGRFKLGATLEYVGLNYEESQLFYLNLEPGNAYWDDVDVSDDETSRGYAWSIGALAELVRNEAKGIYLTTGFTYRSDSDTSLDEDVEDSIQALFLDQLLFQKPISWDLGVAFTKALSKLNSTLTLSAQKGITDFGSANAGFDLEYDHINYGLEYIVTTKSDWAIAFRGGAYDSTTDHAEWPDMDAVTGGIEFKIGERWSLSGTHEIRNLTATDTLEAKEFGLSSFAANYSF